MTDELRLAAAKIIDRMAFSDSHQPATDNRRKTWLANRKARIERAVAKADEILALVGHEAPAEGAGERERLADAYIAGAMSVHEYWTENPGEAPRGDPEFGEAAGDYAYSILSDLRARSSAPEAREGYPQAAWGCVARLSDNAPWEAFTATEVQPDPAGAWSEIIPLYTHPAAPSADKLREAFLAGFKAGGDPDGLLHAGDAWSAHQAAANAEEKR